MKFEALGNECASVLLVDDHPIIAEGIQSLLQLEPGLRLVGYASTGPQALALAQSLAPDLALVDIQLGQDSDMNGLEVLRHLRLQHPTMLGLMLTTFQSPGLVHEAMRVGAAGYLLKSMLRHQLHEALRVVRAGQTFFPPGISDQLCSVLSREALTPREIKVLSMVAKGGSNREIGHVLGIAEDTVKAHMRHIMNKLDAQDRTHAVTMALSRGWISLHDVAP